MLDGRNRQRDGFAAGGGGGGGEASKGPNSMAPLSASACRFRRRDSLQEVTQRTTAVNTTYMMMTPSSATMPPTRNSRKISRLLCGSEIEKPPMMIGGAGWIWGSGGGGAVGIWRDCRPGGYTARDGCRVLKREADELYGTSNRMDVLVWMPGGCGGKVKPEERDNDGIRRKQARYKFIKPSWARGFTDAPARSAHMLTVWPKCDIMSPVFCPSAANTPPRFMLGGDWCVMGDAAVY